MIIALEPLDTCIVVGFEYRIMRHGSIEQALIYALQEIKERSYDYVRI